MTEKKKLTKENIEEQTLLALKLSLEHWERMAADERIRDRDKEIESIFGHHCALCAVYLGERFIERPEEGVAFVDDNSFSSICSALIDGEVHFCPLFEANERRPCGKNGDDDLWTNSRWILASYTEKELPMIPMLRELIHEREQK